LHQRLNNYYAKSIRLIVKLVVDAWLGQVKRVDGILEEMNDEQLQQEIAPGKNSGLYLIGHLAAIHDAMLPLLKFPAKAASGIG
jgi:hypothetical protein